MCTYLPMYVLYVPYVCLYGGIEGKSLFIKDLSLYDGVKAIRRVKESFTNFQRVKKFPLCLCFFLFAFCLEK